MNNYKKSIYMILPFLIMALNSSCAFAVDQPVRDQIAQANLQIDALEKKVESMNASNVPNQKNIEILNKLDSLQDQIANLNGQIATISADQKKQADIQQQLNISIQDQLDQLQKNIKK